MKLSKCTDCISVRRHVICISDYPALLGSLWKLPLSWQAILLPVNPWKSGLHANLCSVLISGKDFNLILVWIFSGYFLRQSRSLRKKCLNVCMWLVMLCVMHAISNALCFDEQVRNHTSVRCVARHSARAPTSSHTAANTRASSLSAARSAPRVSREK